MPTEKIHEMYYIGLRRDIPRILKISSKLIQNAMDGSEKGINRKAKKQSHDNFDNFIKKLMKKKESNITYDSEISKELERSLKYYFVSHLVVDMVQNKSKNFIPSGKIGWKRLSNLGEPYNSYGYNLLLKMGVSSELISVEMIGSKECLLVSELYSVEPNRIKFREPLKTIIKNDYNTAAEYRIRNAERYAKRIENWRAQHPNKPFGLMVKKS